MDCLTKTNVSRTFTTLGYDWIHFCFGGNDGICKMARRVVKHGVACPIKAASGGAPGLVKAAAEGNTAVTRKLSQQNGEWHGHCA